MQGAKAGMFQGGLEGRGAVGFISISKAQNLSGLGNVMACAGAENLQFCPWKRRCHCAYG
jgi:hypothetical protein